MIEYKTLDCNDIATLFELSTEDVALVNKDVLSHLNLRYQILAPKQRDQIILQVIRCVYEENLHMVGEHRQEIWENCWSELKGHLEQDDFGLTRLAPEFMKGFKYFRMAGDFVEPEDPNLFYGLTRILLRTLYSTFCSNATCLYEFGCGSGHNLLPFIEMYPEKQCVGLDWSDSAAALVNDWSATHDCKASGRTFDFFKPDCELDLVPGAAVLTCTALEQIHDGHGPFLDYLLAKRPSICIHVEPFEELYDRENLLDHLAAAYHAKRHYLSGYLTALKALEGQGRVRIVKIQRVRLGNLYNECFSYVVWHTI